MNKQPEALRLADECATGFPLAQDAEDAAMELRHQHALIEELREALKNLLAVSDGDGGTVYHAQDIARAALDKAEEE